MPEERGQEIGSIVQAIEFLDQHSTEFPCVRGGEVGQPAMLGVLPNVFVRLDFNSTNTSPCRDMTYVLFPDRCKSLATKNLRRLVPRIKRNSLLGNRLR